MSVLDILTLTFQFFIVFNVTFGKVQVMMLELDNEQSPISPVRIHACDSLFVPSRMKDTSKKNNIFSQFRKNDRDKQKLIETVVKQLRSLVNGMSS